MYPPPSPPPLRDRPRIGTSTDRFITAPYQHRPPMFPATRPNSLIPRPLSTPRPLRALAQYHKNGFTSATSTSGRDDGAKNTLFSDDSRLSEGVQPQKKSNTTGKRSYDTLTMKIDFYGAASNEQPMVEIMQPPKANIATITTLKHSGDRLWACPMFKVNPSLHSECRDKYFRTEESLRHKGGHLDSKHGDLWYVRERKRPRYSSTDLVGNWRQTLISIFHLYADRKDDLSPYHGENLIEDDSDEVEMRRLQMADLQMRGVDRGDHRHHVGMAPETQLWHDPPGCTFSPPITGQPVGIPATLEIPGPPTTAGAVLSISFESGQTSSFEQNSSLSGPSKSSATSLAPPRFAPRIDPKPIGSKSVQSDQCANDRSEVTLTGANPGSDYPTPPQHEWSEAAGHDSSSPWPDDDHLSSNNDTNFTPLHKPFDTHMEGENEFVQDASRSGFRRC